MSLVEGRSCSGKAYVRGRASGEVLSSDLELSFWGGVDPSSGDIIDRHHPLHGRCLRDKILVIPGGRGSCTGSGVMLELILNGKGPKAMVFEREDDILTLGVIVAEEVFGRSIPVVTLATEDFRRVAKASHLDIDGSDIRCTGPNTDGTFASPSTSADAPVVGRVDLSDVDRAFSTGDRGPSGRAAMRIITRMAEVQGASRLIDVTRVHVDGCIYTGPGSLLFAEKLRDLGGRVVVPTTLNAISVDRERWRAQGIEPSFGEPASRLADAYTDMGARPTFTCAPYLMESNPAFGEQIAWAESNAVVFGNSVLGARTMKYPDFLDICIALTGRAPLAGAHLAINRKAGLCVRISDVERVDESFYPLLGYTVGRLAGNRIPVVVGLDGAPPSWDDLKAFGAAFATVSSAPMFHIVGVTPEAATLEDVTAANPVETVRISVSDLEADWKELNSAAAGRVDLISLGNPHFSLNEIERLAALCRGLEKHPGVAVVVTTGRAVHDRAVENGSIAALEDFGVQFVTDTCWCMITDPIIPPTARVIMTNSAKYAHYGPGLTGRLFRFGSLAACVEAATSGLDRNEAPAWMTSGRTTPSP